MIIDRKTYTDAELPAVRILPDELDGFEIWNQFFRQSQKLSADWKMCKINCSPEEVPDGFAKVTGGYRAILKSGKESWRGRDKSWDRTFFVKMADLRAFEDEYWLARGVCPKCHGEGRTKAKASINPADNRFRKCEKCNGTGISEVKQ